MNIGDRVRLKEGTIVSLPSKHMLFYGIQFDDEPGYNYICKTVVEKVLPRRTQVGDKVTCEYKVLWVDKENYWAVIQLEKHAPTICRHASLEHV